jgi:hypothetical protein
MIRDPARVCDGESRTGASVIHGNRSAIAAFCDCADCRQYRLWRAEGTDEWQPKREDWDAWATATDPAAVERDAAERDLLAEPISSF